MSIVLPKRAHVDFLAPSKALQDAKKKLGPIYFDAKLIECPQNAVELSKLIQEWDEIDKKKFKVLEEARRSQRILLHTLGSRYTFSKHVSGLSSTSDLRDVKLPPPGFRYHSDGSPKLSLVSDQDHFPEYTLTQSWFDFKNESDEDAGRPKSPQRQHLHNEDGDIPEVEIEHASGNVSPYSVNSEIITDTYVIGESKITIEKVEKHEPSYDNHIDYESEIRNLENIIKEINEDLEKNNIDLYENSGSAKGKVYAFLRAHARGDKVSLKQLVEPNESYKPNDRFAILPGSSTFNVSESSGKSKKFNSDFYKRKDNIRNHSHCVACVCKIKHDNAVLTQKRRDVSKMVLKRWNSSTRGTISDNTALSTAILNRRAYSSDSLRRKQSDLSRASNYSPTRISKPPVPGKNEEYKNPNLHAKKSSQVVFKTDIPTRNSHPSLDSINSTDKPYLEKQRNSREHVKLRNAKSAASQRKTEIFDRRSHSAMLNRPSSSSIANRSRMDFLKEDARLEEQECTRKVEAFVAKIKKMTAPPKPSYAFI